ncbi:TonB-dependent receptor plug domain-containing protein [Spirosoma endbachense]|uniref:TonB-dependent receptor plug domain-containing protein n=1 Tax=Spirosoma endbachense TaxID=2666025 RepID=A0A6P1W142_9BACT|nr:TonB-dependent receptor plug domain-containing protein [Spirosoma endbachense]QHV97396.1 TonB-dependent receptor plug domain-containing protein [Spirosoma endbachense]
MKDSTQERMRSVQLLVGRTKYCLSHFFVLTPLMGLKSYAAAVLYPDSKRLERKSIFQADTLIKGEVTDEKGMAMPGVTIQIKESNRGTITDASGKYSITAPGNSVLVFSFVGYLTQEVPLNGRTRVKIKLLESEQNLNEIIVTGYTTQRKKDIIGAVSVVSAKDLQQTPSPNIMAQLQGRAAGVTVSTSGDPSATSSIRIRGFASYGNNNPLYIVDGVATTDITRINPEDIESLQVLKDASAASIYGARAVNGVVIITTKHGKSGTTSLTYNSYIGVQQVPLRSMPPMLSPVELMLDLIQLPGQVRLNRCKH